MWPPDMETWNMYQQTSASNNVASHLIEGSRGLQRDPVMYNLNLQLSYKLPSDSNEMPSGEIQNNTNSCHSHQSYVSSEESTLVPDAMCDNVSTNCTLDNPNIEKSIAFCSSFVENGEWLYNLTRSIVEAEQELPQPTSTLSDSLSKMLINETNTFTTCPNVKSCIKLDGSGTTCKDPVNVEIINNVTMTVIDNNEYINFMNYLKNSRQNLIRASIKETNEDLFALPIEYSLAQCVSEDLWLNNEIAMIFRSKFGRVDEIYAQKERAGGLAILNVKGRFVYYLVTKRLSTDQTIVQSLFNSLRKMQKHMALHGIKKLAIMKMLSHFDGIQYTKVKPMLEYIFRRSSVKIKICNIQPKNYFNVPVELTQCRVTNVDYPLTDIDVGTLIVYYGSKDGFITEEMRKLNSKFRILIDYRMANRSIGDIIPAYKDDHNYLLCGFIVKQTKGDQFDLVNFQKCVCGLSKLNSKKQNRYSYVAIEAFSDEDELIMNKIVNILRYSLHYKAEIYVCWPMDLKNCLLLPITDNGVCI